MIRHLPQQAPAASVKVQTLPHRMPLAASKDVCKTRGYGSNCQTQGTLDFVWSDQFKVGYGYRMLTTIKPLSHAPLHLLQVMVMLRKQNHLPTYIKIAEKKACVKSTTQMPDVVKSGILRNHNGLAFFLCQIGFIATPKPRVDTLMTVWHNQNYLGGSQSKSERRIAWSLQQRSNIQILRVGQHAAPSISRPSWPWMLHFRQKLKNAFLPGMTYEQIAIQALWISHQSPAHQSSISCHRLDVLLIHRVDAWSIPESCPFPFCGPLWNPDPQRKRMKKAWCTQKEA